MSLLNIKYNSIWTVQHSRDSKIIWEDSGKNSLAEEGQEAILETFFRNGTSYIPTQFYIRLCNQTLLITSTLSSVATEPIGNGYSAYLIPRSIVGLPTKALVSGSWSLTSLQASWTAAGDQIGPVSTAYLATTSDNTGSLIAFRALSQTRTILVGDTMTLYFGVALA